MYVSFHPDFVILTRTNPENILLFPVFGISLEAQ